MHIVSKLQKKKGGAKSPKSSRRELKALLVEAQGKNYV